jgi:hypothetical protein
MIMCRVKHLEEDFALLLDDINRRRLPGAPLMTNGFGWEQQGPIAKEVAKEGVEQADTSRSRHAAKFAECGDICLHNVNVYYERDFEILQYPMHSVDVQRLH